MKLSLALAGLVVAKDDGDRKFVNNVKFMDAATKSWWFDAAWDEQRRLDSISERWADFTAAFPLRDPLANLYAVSYTFFTSEKPSICVELPGYFRMHFLISIELHQSVKIMLTSHQQPIIAENDVMLMTLKEDQEPTGWTGTTNGRILTKSHGTRLI